MARMARALAWKEWREQRPVVLAGLALTVSMPLFLAAGLLAMQRDFSIADLADGMPLLLGGLVWPLFAAACGATTISNEIGDGTLGFLLSRPVSRARVWLVKVAVGCLALLAIMAGSVAMLAVFSLLAGGGGIGPWVGTPAAQSALPLLAGVTGTAVIFTAAVFFSTFIGRAMTAAAAGLTTALCLLAGIVIVWSRLDLVPRLEPALVLGEAALAAALLLLASYHVFSRGEMLRGNSVRRSVAVGLVLAAGGAALIGAPLIYSQVRLNPDSAVLADVTVSPRGDSIAVAAAPPEGGSAQVWLIHADGSGFERLTGRLAYLPAFSPDGARVAYVSFRGWLGLRSGRPSLHVVAADGSEERTLAADFPEMIGAAAGGTAWNPLVFSPDGSRIALIAGGDLMSVPVDGGPPSVMRLAGTRLERGRLIGWRTDGSEIILMSPYWLKAEGTTVAAFDPRTGDMRIVHETGATHAFTSWRPAPAGGIDTLPLLLKPDDATSRWPRKLILVDLRSGASREISDEACLGTDLSDDGRVLVYATCPDDTTTMSTHEIHRLDLATMEDHPIGTLEGRLWDVLIAPSSDRVATQRALPDGPPPSVAILDMEGHVVELPPGWSLYGWSGRNRLVVGDSGPGGAAPRLALADADTGVLHEIHPGTGLIQ